MNYYFSVPVNIKIISKNINVAHYCEWLFGFCITKIKNLINYVIDKLVVLIYVITIINLSFMLEKKK